MDVREIRPSSVCADPSMDRLDEQSLGGIAHYLDAKELLRLILTGCLVLRLKLVRSIHDFVLTDASRFSTFPYFLFDLPHLHTAVISTKYSHQRYPLRLSGRPILVSKLPELSSLSLNFAQSFSVLNSKDEASLRSMVPNLTILSLRGSNRGLTLDDFVCLPSFLIKLALCSAYQGDSEVNYKALQHLPSSLQHIELGSVVIVEDEEEYKNQIEPSPTFPELESLHATFSFLSVLNHLPSTLEDLSITIRSQTHAPLRRTNVLTSSLPQRLKTFELLGDTQAVRLQLADVRLIFDAPMPATLTSLGTQPHFLENTGFDMLKHIQPGIKSMHPNAHITEQTTHLLAPDFSYLMVHSPSRLCLLKNLPSRLESLCIITQYDEGQACVSSWPSTLTSVSAPFTSVAELAELPRSVTELEIEENDAYPIHLTSDDVKYCIKRLKKLEHLTMNLNAFVNADSLAALPNTLKTLHLWCSYRSPYVITLIHESKDLTCKLPKSITDFSLQFYSIGRSETAGYVRDWLEQLSHFDNLTNLVVSFRASSRFCARLGSTWLRQLPPSLRSLDIRLPNDSLYDKELLKHLPSELESLRLGVLAADDGDGVEHHITDESFDSLPASLTSLSADFECEITTNFFSVIPPAIIDFSIFNDDLTDARRSYYTSEVWQGVGPVLPN